ncbi:MAG: hypothetical protein ACYTEQ_21345 [Planctomycetota bacterium]|jgi:hypothetical protein
MEATTLIAVVGAAAWVPQIISWVNSWLAKPRLRFVPGEVTEIGYNALGPIFNHNFAISTSRKDALVERIRAVVVHESGARHEFHWRFLSERGAEFTSTSGEVGEFTKNQPAIALKISILGLTEKKIGFQDLAHQQNLVRLLGKQREKQGYLEKTGVANYRELLVGSEEFLNVLDYVKRAFYWREGKYDVGLYVYEASLRKPHVEQYRFALSRSEVEQLEKNIEATQEHLKDVVLYAGKKGEEWPRRFWNWANPGFYRVDDG